MPTNLARANNSERSAPTIKATGKDRWPLWLIIFPEGTILSDEERAKSLKYATREGTVGVYQISGTGSQRISARFRYPPPSSLYWPALLPSHAPTASPRSSIIGRHHWLSRSAIWQIPARMVRMAKAVRKADFDRYGLLPVFLRSVPPPTVHIHLHLYSDLSSPDSEIPSLISKPLMKPPKTIAGDVPPTNTGLATPAESKTFELWLRSVWTEKEKRMKGFFNQGKFESAEGGANAREIVPIRQA